MPRSCVLIVCNAAYMEYVAQQARLIRTVEAPDYDIVVASPDPPTPELTQSGAIYAHIDVKGFIQELPVNLRLGQYTYWRFCAIEALAARYERILYLDSDVYCAAPGINALLEIDLKGCPLAAVRDVHQQYRPTRWVEEYAIVDRAQSHYFNAGVLLIDAARWRDDRRFAKIEDLCRAHPKALIRHDQSALNLSFYRDWLELSPVWNWQYSKKNASLALLCGPRLIHYFDRMKIWTPYCGAQMRQHWLSFSPRDDASQGLSRRDLRKMHLRNLIAGLWYRRRTLAYVERFRDDFDTHRVT